MVCPAITNSPLCKSGMARSASPANAVDPVKSQAARATRAMRDVRPSAVRKNVTGRLQKMFWTMAIFLLMIADHRQALVASWKQFTRLGGVKCFAERVRVE